MRLRTYFLAFFGLVVLSALTLALSFAELGALELPIALVIATVKATVVALFFMHLVEKRGVEWIYLVTGFVLIATLVALVVLDVRTRV